MVEEVLVNCAGKVQSIEYRDISKRLKWLSQAYDAGHVNHAQSCTAPKCPHSPVFLTNPNYIIIC
jgi:hypothetical protein